ILRTRADRMAGYVDPISSDAAMREAHGEPLEPEEAVGLFVHDMWGHPFNNIFASMQGRPSDPVAEAIWTRREKYRPYLPKRAAEAETLRDLLDALLDFAARWQRGREER